jgi:hypothetical protein
MKIILEFSDEEARQAEQAYRGPDYALATEDFRAYLRDKRKHGNLSEEAQLVVIEIEQVFFDTYEGLLRD